MSREGQAKVEWNTVTVRDLLADEVGPYVEYWHDPSNSFLDEMGVDRARLPAARKMREQLILNIERGVQTSLLTVLCDGEPVGVHELTDISFGETGTMHAQIWRAQHRGKGIGRISYVKAMKIYFDRYKLQAIEFRTPQANIAANRIKQAIGLTQIAKVDYRLPIFDRPVPAVLYRADADELPALISRSKAACTGTRSKRLIDPARAPEGCIPNGQINTPSSKGTQHDSV